MHISFKRALAAAAAAVLAGCGGGGASVREVSFEVASQRATCQTVQEQLCYLTRSAEAEAWQNLYESIDGLNYEWGKQYAVRVQVTERPQAAGVEDTGSVLRTYRLIAVTAASPVPASTEFTLSVRRPTTSLLVDPTGAWSLLGQALACDASVCAALQAARGGTAAVELRVNHQDSPARLRVVAVDPAP